MTNYKPAPYGYRAFCEAYQNYQQFGLNKTAHEAKQSTFRILQVCKVPSPYPVILVEHALLNLYEFIYKNPCAHSHSRSNHFAQELIDSLMKNLAALEIEDKEFQKYFNIN